MKNITKNLVLAQLKFSDLTKFVNIPKLRDAEIKPPKVFNLTWIHSNLVSRILCLFSISD